MQHATALNQMMMMMDNKEWFYSKKTAFFRTFSMNYLDPAPWCIYHQGGLSYEAQPSVLTGYQLTRPGPGTQSQLLPRAGTRPQLEMRRARGRSCH